MPLVDRVAKLLSLENMSQMTSAIRAHNLRPLHPQRPVCMPCHRAGHCVKERRPPTPAVELVTRLIEWRVAARTRVLAAGGRVLVVLARARILSALLPQDAELLWRQLGAPLVVGLLDGVVCHFAGLCGGGEECSDEGDGHRRAELLGSRG